ncbi:MAG: M23 family metallopeptidase [Bacteroidetes bacterium]|nr:M23 family metallopeptidase [Bacteroidota bacterium]
MFRNRKYILDLSDLQYKQIRLPFKARLLRALMWFSLSVIITLVYVYIFRTLFGSPKENLLTQQVDNLKLQYALVGRQLDNSISMLNSFRLSDDIRYRPILDMDTIPESYRKAGFGGINRYKDLSGFINTEMLISYRSKIDMISNMANVQNESFRAIAERAAEWKMEKDHAPMISPVDVKYRLGDGFRFREVHPVLGTPRMHYGQDFEVPYGTEVYATGNGTVIESGWNSMGFGNFVVIDHGYGLRSTYGHLSKINIAKGVNVKRGDLIGYSGNTGTSSGPHLHYQIDQFGQHKNPINFFNDDMTVDEYTEMIQMLASRTKFR